METIRIDTGQLKSAGEAVLLAVSGAEKNTESISSALSRLDSMWEGEAEEGFKALLNEDIASLHEVISTLRHIAEYETEASASYEECEMKVIEEAAALI